MNPVTPTSGTSGSEVVNNFLSALNSNSHNTSQLEKLVESLRTQKRKDKAQINELNEKVKNLEQSNSQLIRNATSQFSLFEEVRLADEQNIANLKNQITKLKEELKNAKSFVQGQGSSEPFPAGKEIQKAPIKATHGISSDDSHTSNSKPTHPTQPTAVKPSKTLEVTSPIPEAGDPSDFFQKDLPDHTYILLLGETGVGKSTFINSLVNYVQHPNMEDAERNGPTVLIPASFSMKFGDNFGTSTRIVCDPTVGAVNRLKKNENLEPGQPATQGAKEYTFTFTRGNQKKTLHIIDTPGIGDVRGIEKDEINWKKIQNFIANYKELHAICILLKPNQARLNVVFKFCIDQLLMHLHRSAADSIVFCFTSTRGSHYRAEDSYATLQTHLQNLHRTNGTRIDLNENTTYFLDNEGFRYLCAKKQGHSFNPVETAEYKTSYAHSLKEVKRLTANIALRRTHQVLDTICVNSTRHLLFTLMEHIYSSTHQRENIDAEFYYMKHCEVELASFLKKSSIIAYNVSYGEHVKFLIKAADQKAQKDGDTKLLYQLIEHQQQYKKEVALLEKDDHSRGEIRNQEDLKAMVDKLHKLKHCGSQIAQLHRAE